jgi:septal ring factor EnvC (AmiA/AmiB activator)
MELYNYTQGGTLENLKHENSLEKNQIEQLMLKLREKDSIQEDLENEVNEISETLTTLNRKLKELEDRNTELEKEYKPLKK